MTFSETYHVLAHSLYQVIALVLAGAGAIVYGLNLNNVRDKIDRRVRFWAGVAVAAQGAATVLVFVVVSEGPVRTTVLSNWAMLGVAGLVLPLGLAYSPDPPTLRRKKLPMLLVVPAGAVAAILVSHGLVLLFSLVTEVKPGRTLELLLESERGLLALIPVALLAALIEEVVFRLGLQGVLEAWCKRLGVSVWWAIAATSFVFALGHAGMIDPDGIKELQIFAASMVFGYLKAAYGLRVAIYAHLGLNTYSIAMEAIGRAAGG